MKTWKKCPQKLLIISPQTFFSTGPAAQMAQKTEILYHQKPLNAGLGIYIGIDANYEKQNVIQIRFWSFYLCV